MRRKLQVFVSSTFSDLIDERQAAVAAILKAGHIPAGMELFTAGDKSQMQTIERWIDDSDVYMLILGGRYGSVEPTSSLSYTELEYDYALAHQKPFFSVVIQNDALEIKLKNKGSASIERENPKALAQFREKVLSNMSSFFSDPKDIKLCVFESLSDLAARPDLRGWISANEIPDTEVLNEEIKKLREENLMLAETIKKMDILAQSSISVIPKNNEQELIALLKAIEIKVPADLAGGEEKHSNLLEVAFVSRDLLINGISNKQGMTDHARFYYFNILPKLQAHGLADNEALQGVRYRRSYLNQAGMALLANVEKERLLSKL